MTGSFVCHEHRAAGRVLADECALRSAQNLDAGDVVIGLFRDIAGKGRRRRRDR